MPRKKKLTCEDCGDCCTYVAIEIDRPTSKTDYSDLFWYLLHKDIAVFIDHDNEWHLEFQSVCTAIDQNKKCRVYEDRPIICRKYTLDTCTKHSTGEYFKHKFTTPESLKRYLKKRGIDYKFKRMPK